MKEPRYLRISVQASNHSFTKRVLARGTDEQVLAALNEAYPGVSFLQVIEHVEMHPNDTVRFID